jgi:membrane protein implicated in regulation of membrane protease activity
MKKFLILAGGWFLTIVGGILTPVPLPLPFPLGIMMFLVGCAILTTHSKPFRRAVQQLRHRNGWLSHGLEKLTHRAPRQVKTMEAVTRPVALGRKARMQSRRAGEPG